MCWWWLGGDVLADVKGRLPFWASDWHEGASYRHRIIAPSLYIFFASVLPALAFGEQLARETDGQLTVVHVLVATAIAGVTQALVGGQPLLILGVAEPIVIIYSFLYQFASDQAGLGSDLFLPWCSWVCVWTSLLCALVAISGACRGIGYFTRMAGELFGMLIAVLFMQQAVKGLISEFRNDSLSEAQSGPLSQPWLLVNGLWALVLAAGLLGTCLTVVHARDWRLGTGWIRGMLADYGVPALVVAWSGLSFALASSGNPAGVPAGVPRRIVTQHTWEVTGSWSVARRMAEVPGGYVAAALLPAVTITVLFWFDHGVSAKMAQPKAFHLRKPPAYAWDMLLLAALTLLMGLLGLPPVNGVLPQAPMHTHALAKLWQRKHRPDTHHEDAATSSKDALACTTLVEAPTEDCQAAFSVTNGTLSHGHVATAGPAVSRSTSANICGQGADGVGLAAQRLAVTGTNTHPGGGESGSQHPQEAPSTQVASGHFLQTFDPLLSPAQPLPLPQAAHAASAEFLQTYCDMGGSLQPALPVNGCGSVGSLVESAAQPSPLPTTDHVVLRGVGYNSTNAATLTEWDPGQSGHTAGQHAHDDAGTGQPERAPAVGVAEQRVSNLIQSLLVAACLGLTYAIKQVPTSVVWGFFSYMALESLAGSQFAERLLWLVTDPSRRVARSYLRGVPGRVTVVFTAIQFCWLAGVWALTTWAGVAGVAFPVAIVTLLPVRFYILPILIPVQHLSVLDCEEVI